VNGARLTSDGAGDAGRAQVVATAFLGAATRVTVRLSDGTEVKADLPTHEAAALAPGAPVTVSLPERPVLVAVRGPESS
jgi:putative spermidine/putrescine transport system ATP-binding protein